MKKNKIIAVISSVAVFAMYALVGIGVAPASAAVTTNVAAGAVAGQASMTAVAINQGGAVAANTMYWPRGMWSDGTKLVVAEEGNNRVLIFNHIPESTDAAADVVIGQADMTSNSANQGGSAAANTLQYPYSVYSDGEKLFIADTGNNRVLIYNRIPTTNNVAADVVVGQVNMSGNSVNQGGSAGQNKLANPLGVYSDGIKLIVSDGFNNRALIYNSIPTTNNANADVVVGQADMNGSAANQGGAVAANTLNMNYGLYSNGKKLFIADWGNDRILIYNSIPTSNDTSADVVVGQPNMTSSSISAAAANTLVAPSEVYAFGKKLAVTDRGNNRVLIYNAIPTSNGASADVAIGQADMSGSSADQGGSAAANTLNAPRGLTFGGTKMFVADTDNNRVLVYEFGPQYAVGKSQSAALWNGEKLKVSKTSLDFSGKRTDLKKGRVRLIVNGSSKKVVKIAKSGKWSIKYKHKAAATLQIRFKFYNSHGTNMQNPAEYVIQVSHSGRLTPVMLESADLQPKSFSSDGSGGDSNGKVKHDLPF